MLIKLVKAVSGARVAFALLANGVRLALEENTGSRPITKSPMLVIS